MGLFDKGKEPVFLKEESSTKQQIEQLPVLRDKIRLSLKKDFERDLRFLKAGIYGEDPIAYEIKNSPMPHGVIHDFYMEYKGLTAQINDWIITRKRNFIIKCKNRIGNIEVSDAVILSVYLKTERRRGSTYRSRKTEGLLNGLKKCVLTAGETAICRIYAQPESKTEKVHTEVSADEGTCFAPYAAHQW